MDKPEHLAGDGTSGQLPAAVGGSAPSASAYRLRHDLRNHLNHLIGFGELILEDMDSATMVAFGALERICGDSRHASAFLDDWDQGRPGIDPTRLPELIDLVAAQLDAFKHELSASGASNLDLDVERMVTAAASASELASELAGLGGPTRVSASPSPTGPQVHPGLVTAPTDSAPKDAAARLILVVDDDKDNRDLLARRIEKLGYSVMVAGNGVQALAIMEADPVELVLLDLMMPEMDGFEVLRRRNADEAIAAIPVVMISSESDVSSVARCIEMGADDYLPKPFEPALLNARIRTCLEKKQFRDNERRLLAALQDKTDQLIQVNATLESRVSAQVEEINGLARLRRFLSPQLADLVVSSGKDLLHNHRRQIAVLFCDLRGFTSFSETAEPEEVMDVLHEFHQAFGKLTHRFGATVGFFAGDGIMVFFNDPVPCANPPEQAVRMAVALREAMEPMERSWRRRDYSLGFGVGISYGYATLGEIGFEGRFDYGVIGTVVNLAARLCDHAADGQILVSRRAYLAVEDLADSEEIGNLALKGFQAPVTVFNVIRIRSATPAV